MATVYAGASSAWILFSDLLVSLLPYPVISSVQSAKGFFFVAVTSVLMYVLVERLGERISSEAARLSTVERMLGQVVATVPVGVLLTSDDGTVTFVNRAAEELLSVESEEALGCLAESLCCADGNGAATFGELMRVGTINGVKVGGHDNAPVRSVLARAAAIDPTVPSSGWVIAMSDVTEAEQAHSAAVRLVGGYRFLADALEAVLRASDERALLRRLAEVAVESNRYCAAWAIAADENGRYLDVATVGMGSRARETAGMIRDRADQDPSALPFVPGEIVISNDIIRDPASVWHPAALEESCGSVASLGIVGRRGLSAGLVLFTREIGAFDAREIEMLNTLLEAVSFAFGRLTLDRKRLDAEQELENSAQGYRGLFEDNPAPMWVWDRDSLRVLAVNKAAVGKYGFRSDEFLEMAVSDILYTDEVPRFLDGLKRGRVHGDAGIWTHRDHSGREFPVHMYSHVIDWDGRSAELVMAMEVARIE